MSESRRPPSALSLWYEEHLEGLALPLAVLIGIGVLAALYLFGIVAENVVALLLALAVVGGSCAYGAMSLLASSGTRRSRAIVIAVCVATVGLALIPVVSTLIPGSPEVRGRLHAPGDAFALPDDAHGPVRLLVHGQPAGAGEAEIGIALDVGATRVLGHLSRTTASTQIGRRGRGTTVQEHDSEYLTVVVPGDVNQIELASLDGELTGPLVVDVFPEFVPYRVELWLAVLLLVAAAVVAARTRGDGSSVGALAVALVFALAVYRVATPNAALRPEIGALFIGLIGGGVGGTALAWLVGKVVGPRLAPPGGTPSRG